MSNKTNSGLKTNSSHNSPYNLTIGLIIGLLIIFMILTVVNFSAAASYNKTGDSIQTKYSEGEIIRGIVNISFSDVSSNAKLSSNFGGNISLLELLEANGYLAGSDFSCTTANCITGYAPTGSPLNSILWNSPSPLKIGFKISGDVIDIDDINFGLSSDAPVSCFNQVLIEVFGERDYSIANYNNLSEACNDVKRYGCFNKLLSSYSYNPIGANGFCEKITLPAATAYRLGANITNSTTSAVNVDLTMRIYNLDGEQVGTNCKLPKHSVNASQELECSVNFPLARTGDYFVCITANGGNYKIRSELNETAGEKCGISGTGNIATGNSDKDYEIYAMPLKSASVNIQIDDTSFGKFNEGDLVDAVNEYVERIYNGDCNPYCIIPFAITTSQPQTITFSNPIIKYTILEDAEQPGEGNELFRLASSIPSITSSKLELELEPAEFKIPFGTSEKKFILYLDENKIFEKEITIRKSFDFSISPRFALVGQKTKFTASTAGSNITSSSWDFGDGETIEVNGSSAAHIYLDEDNYDVEVEVARKDGSTAKKTFVVIAGDLDRSINLTISKYEKRIANLSKQINSYPAWVLKHLDKQLSIDEINSSLKNLKQQYENEENYTDLIYELLELNVPYSISVIDSGVLPIDIGFENINLNALEKITGKEGLSSNEQLKLSLIDWLNKNYDAKIRFEVISSLTDTGEEPLLTKFKIETNSKSPNENADDVYLVINYPVDGINFLSDYSQKSADSATYLPLSALNAVEFTILDEIEAQDLGIYIAPKLSEIETFEQPACIINNICEEGENVLNCRADCKPTGKATFWFIVLILSVLVLYIALQEWYKRYYEKFLFKNPDDLYNLLNFIDGSRKSGAKDETTKEKLKKIGWKNEQLIYAFKKIDSKRTGMFEIPLFKAFEKIKLKNELMKRQARQEQKGQAKAPNKSVQ